MRYCTFYKPSDPVGLVKTAYNIMLDLGIYFLRVVGTYKSYTEFVPWKFVRNYC